MSHDVDAERHIWASSTVPFAIEYIPIYSIEGGTVDEVQTRHTASSSQLTLFYNHINSAKKKGKQFIKARPCYY